MSNEKVEKVIIGQADIDNYVIVNVKFSETRSLSADADSESIKLKPVMKVNNVTVGDLIAAAFGTKWISKQASLRKVFSTLKPNQSVEFEFNAPGRQVQLTAAQQMKLDAIAAGVDVDDKEAYMAFVVKQLENV